MSNIENRRHALGRYGEMIVREWLAQAGFSCIVYLGATNPYYDFAAYKDGQKYLISVKARNGTTDKGDLKRDDYNLWYPEAKVQKALVIAREQNAIPIWVTVTIDAIRQEYTVCYGRVHNLANKSLIPMSPADISTHDKFGANIFDPRIDERWSNVRAG
jgi:hypothetical protein